MKDKIHRPVAWDFKEISPYGPRTHPKTGELGKMHYGKDLGTPIGTPVVASVTGRIVMAGWEDPQDHDKGYGYRIWQFEPERDIFVCYGHLSQIDVNEGDEVVAGTRVGLTGNSGSSSGPHIHQELRKGGIAGVKGSDFDYL